ncbi:MAG: DUF2029 domain-containing protein [Chloroflexi bacterium]|nr:DUF2029 domain-containing protein [Chloroflexota bacterium]
MTDLSLPSRSTWTSRRILLGVGIAASWLLFIALAWVQVFRGRFGMIDFGAYYEGAQRLLSGQPLYQGYIGNTYIYPPLLAQMLMPMTALSRQTANALWFILNLGLLAGVAAILDRISQRRGFWWIMTPLFFPALEAVVVGQITIVMLALFVAVWVTAHQKKAAWCGGILAFASWLKIYPALMILYFIWKRDWRVVRSALIVGVVLALLQIGISGFGTFSGIVGVLSPLTQVGQPNLASGNASVFGFTSQLFGESERVQPLIASTALQWLARGLLSVGLLGGCFYLLAKRGKPDAGRFDLEFSLTLLTSLLLSPTLFVAGMPPLLLVYALLLRNHPTKRMIWFVVLACITLSIYWLFVLGYAGTPPVSGLLLSFGFYTLLATWGVNAYRLHRRIQISARDDYRQAAKQ